MTTPTKKATCTWTQDGEDSDIWATDCANLFTLNDGTPSENLMEFCCYCGRHLKEEPYVHVDDEDD